MVFYQEGQASRQKEEGLPSPLRDFWDLEDKHDRSHHCQFLRVLTGLNVIRLSFLEVHSQRGHPGHRIFP